jgi:hypothetical protein
MLTWEKQMSDFYRYFKENMDELGLPAPESLFGSMQVALSNATVFVTQLDKFGRRVTVGELVGDGMRLERLGVAGALSASYYVGAVIGSIAVAAGRSLSGGISLGDVLLLARKNGLSRSWLVEDLRRWPGIYDKTKPGRRMYRLMVKRS